MSEPKKRGRPPKSAARTAPSPIASHEEGVLSTDGKRERPSRKRGVDVNNALYAPKREGYQRYWAADYPGAIEKMEAKDWSFVKDDAGEKIRTPAGHGYWHYLMEIPTEWYQEDLQEESKKNRSYDVETNETLPSNEYVPMGHSAVVTRK